VNTLEYLREIGFNDDEEDGFDDDEMEAAMYVISKHYLDSPIENKQELIDYFNNRQRADGAWGKRCGKRPKLAMFILQAHLILGAKPKNSLEPFLSMYDTWEEAKNYGFYDPYPRMDKYHIVSCWVFYYGENPPWTQELIEFYEESLDWINGPNMHERTHILYSYLATGHQFPNADEIIETTLLQQNANGFWSLNPYPTLCETAQQVTLLSVMKEIYPERAGEIQSGLDKAKSYLLSTYKTVASKGKTYGYFQRKDVKYFHSGVSGAVSSELVDVPARDPNVVFKTDVTMSPKSDKSEIHFLKNRLTFCVRGGLRARGRGLESGHEGQEPEEEIPDSYDI
jgi:hypothetical protein